MKRDDVFLLEYNPKKGQFHFNQLQGDGRLHHQPNTYGWEPIALTLDDKASLFCNVVDGELHRREREGKSPLTTEEVKWMWKSFCYIYNYIATHPIPEEMETMAKEKFDSATTLARLGNGHFIEDYTISATEYDPLSFEYSNF